MSYECTNCNGLLVFVEDNVYRCEDCGSSYTISKPVAPPKQPKKDTDYKVLFFTLVEHNINKLFGFYLMTVFLLSMMIYTVEWASHSSLAWWYVVIQVLINVSFFYSAYKLGEEKCNIKNK